METIPLTSLRPAENKLPIKRQTCICLRCGKQKDWTWCRDVSDEVDNCHCHEEVEV